MFRVTLLVLLAAATVLVLLPDLSLAQAPALPCRFHGTVQLDGAPVPDGTIISVTVGGNTSSTTTPSVYGESTYAIIIVPPKDTTYNDGTPVTFKIGDYDAIEIGSWENGLNLLVNITASSVSPPTPTPTETPTPTPSPTPAPPTPIPTPTPKAPLNIGRIVGSAIFGLLALLLVGVLAYYVRKFYIRK